MLPKLYGSEGEYSRVVQSIIFTMQYCNIIYTNIQVLGVGDGRMLVLRMLIYRYI